MDGRHDETEWQSDKSLADRMRYMLDNEISTDVCFEVGPPGGETVNIRAHKCMLIAGSPVFEAMFSSGMAECRGPEAKVRVEDIEADIFKELLHYIYSESVSVSSESAVHLMYAAKKYMLPKLVTNCGKCVLDNLNVENVIDTLDISLAFDDKKLQRACLRVIFVNAKAVLTGTEISSASRQVMEAILEAEVMSVSESVIYESAVNWAKHQLQSSIPGGNPTDRQIRETLGDLLYKIRFPAMQPMEFAEICACGEILNAEEKLSVYYYMATMKNNELKFPTEWRTGEEHWVDRSICHASKKWHPHSVDAINFTTNEDVILTGIGLFSAFDERGYEADVEILLSVKSLFKKRVKVPYTGNSTPHKLLLDDPILIQSGNPYSVKVMAHDTIGYYSQTCHSARTKAAITFNFCKHPESVYTGVTHGQIPRFYFCIV